MTWLAAIWLGAAALFLTVAWSVGPQRMVEAAQYAKFTGQVPGRIVDRWLAVELDIPAIRNPANWRASAQASPCAVVEYQGDWSSTPPRRWFCGNRFPFSIDYTLHDLRAMSAGVPFGWSRDASGFIVPEIRIDGETRNWLEAHPVTGLRPEMWPAKSALDELRIELDLPVDAAVAGWLGQPQEIPLVFDPQHPDQALPKGFVQHRLEFGPNWIAVLFAGAAGMIAWLKGTTMLPLLSGLGWPARWLLMVLPLATLPWWGTYFPRELARFNAQWAGVIRDVFADIESTGRLVAFEAGGATLAGGSRLVWRSDSSVYADTFGRFKLAPPTPAPATDDAALAAVAATITNQVRALDASEKVALFKRLQRDARVDLDHAGLVFIPAAKEAMLAHGGDDGVPAAARNFLREWSNRQHLHGLQRLAQNERDRLARELAPLLTEK